MKIEAHADKYDAVRRVICTNSDYLSFALALDILDTLFYGGINSEDEEDEALASLMTDALFTKIEE
jgi:hypothetical protein